MEQTICITNKKLCCGCGACVQACSVNCITMEADTEGFLYPIVDETRCVNCGACVKVCPMQNPKEGPKNISVYAARCLDEETRLNSSSGGVFSLLSEWILNEGGTVFGAAFDADFLVHHIAAHDADTLERLKGSKYLQSRMEDTYRQAENCLKSGVPVLFTGTGCQIAGLKSYLKRDFENLYTVDVLCHGVPSPAVWKKYLQVQRDVHGAEMTEAKFRHKSPSWRSYSVKLDYENGQTYCKTHEQDEYIKLFLSEICLRPSCHHCQFRKSRSGSDLTIGDAWGVEKWMPEMDDDKGTSVVIVNTEKGEKLLDRIQSKMELQKGDAEAILSCNTVYYKSVRPHPNRKRFFRAMENGASMEELTALCRKSLWHRMLSLGKRIIRKLYKTGKALWRVVR